MRSTRTGRPAVRGGFLGAIPTGHLVAREEELGRVMEVLEEAAGGAGRLVLLAGEPGVGKTRMAQEVSVRAWERGLLVAAGRCYEGQSDVPFYPFLEVLAALYEQTSRELREQVPHRWPHLVRLLPDSFPSGATTVGEDPEDLQRLLRAVTGFVREVAALAPVVLLLDDLHWADGASLDLLQHLSRHIRGERVLLLGTYRDVDAGRGHPLRRAARELDREQLVEEVGLWRLSREETAALVSDRLDGSEVSEEFTELVYEHTRGNPFFTVEVLKDLIERTDIFQWEGAWIRRDIQRIEVPESVSETITERYSRLQPETRAVLEEASVLGQTFGFEELRGVSDRNEEEVEDALERTASAGLVQTAGERYSFNHPLTRQTLYERLPPSRRRRLHRAAGKGLERLGERFRQRRAAEISRHFLKGGAPDRALPYALLAGDAAETVFAHREAEGHYRRALELAEEVGDKLSRAQALEKLGLVLSTTVRYDEALSVLRRAAEAHRELEDPEGAGRAEARIAQTYFRRGTPDEGIARLSNYLESLDRPNASESVRHALASLYSGMARLRFALKQYRSCLDAAERAADLSRGVGDERLLADAEVARGTVLLWLDTPDEALAALERGVSLAEGSGALDTLVLGLLGLHRAYVVRGELARSHRCGEQGVSLAERAGDTDVLALHLSNVGLGLFYLGEWCEARARLERGVELVRDAPPSFYSGWPPTYLGVLCLAEGRWDDAYRLLSDAAATAQRAHTLDLWHYTQSRLAELDVLRGCPQDAVARLEVHLEAPEVSWMYDALLLSVLAEAYLETGDTAKAEQLAERAVERARIMHNRVDGVEALRVRGKLLFRRNSREEAVAALEKALSWARSMPYPYAEGKILREYGMLHLRRGDPGQAWHQLSAALYIFRRLGANKDAEKTIQGLDWLR